jgi:hypothetical protein
MFARARRTTASGSPSTGGMRIATESTGLGTRRMK